MSAVVVSRRDVAGMLRQMGAAPVAPMGVDADALASRLRSLAIAGSFEAGTGRGRWGRRVVALVGAVGLIGWTGIGVASASVGLAVTGNLPDPVQNIVSDVFEVVGVDLPRGTSPEDGTGGGSDGDDEDSDGDSGDETPDTSVPPETRPDGPGNSENAPGIIGDTPGQSGNTPGQSGVDPPGQSGNTPGQSGNTPGQSGNTPGRGTMPPSLWPTSPRDPDTAPGNSGGQGNGGNNGSSGGNGNSNGAGNGTSGNPGNR